MTVKELIKKLDELPEEVADYEIEYNDYENGPTDISDVRVRIENRLNKNRISVPTKIVVIG